MIIELNTAILSNRCNYERTGNLGEGEIILAIATLNSHIDTAIQLQERINSAYIVFGKTSAWADEENPPEENDKITEISEIVGYKKLKQFSLARPLKAGEDENNVGYPVVTYNSQKWVLVPKNKAYEEEARWLYAEAEIQPNEFPLGRYRQVGLHLGLTPRTGVSKHNLLPADVQDKGILHFYENREPQNRTSSVYVLEQFMIKV